MHPSRAASRPVTGREQEDLVTQDGTHAGARGGSPLSEAERKKRKKSAYEISGRGVKLPSVSAALGRGYLRHGVCSPQVDWPGPQRITDVRSAPIPYSGL
jgi:hypothetical protein